MEPSQRVITATPMRELWDQNGPVAAHRSRDLTAADLRDLLRRGPVRFVVADPGSRPRWIPEGDCYSFWKVEVQSHLVGPGGAARLDEFAGGYCLFAAEWSPGEGSPIVVLEMAH